MATLWFIRHGQASFGQKNYDCLSPVGILQSEILGDYLLKTKVHFDAIYSGHMKRQKDTAKIVTEKLGAQKMPTPDNQLSGFNEYDFKAIIQGQLPDLMREMDLTQKELDKIWSDNKAFQRVFAKILARWMAGTHDAQGVETFKAYLARVRQGIHTVLEKSSPGEQIAIFTSGGVITAGLQMGLDLTDARARQLGWQIKNTSLTCFTGFRDTHGQNFCDPGPALELMLFNSTAHLDLEQNAELITYR
ncbi:MAG: phosphoglycerate mutase family protein [Proteobacteria bacterium]|nr:phosphoglycerate mutase family protein [Pseudomonadota bacterium]